MSWTGLDKFMAEALELPLRLGSGLDVDHFRIRSRPQTRVVSQRVKESVLLAQTRR